jgi:hypothetical protein
MERDPVKTNTRESDGDRQDAALDRARKFGVDVNLLIENLRLTPEERLIRATTFHNAAVRLTREIARAGQR